MVHNYYVFRSRLDVLTFLKNHISFDCGVYAASLCIVAQFQLSELIRPRSFLYEITKLKLEGGPFDTLTWPPHSASVCNY